MMPRAPPPGRPPAARPVVLAAASASPGSSGSDAPAGAAPKLAQLRQSTVQLLADALDAPMLHRLDQLEAAGASPAAVFASAVQRARRAKGVGPAHVNDAAPGAGPPIAPPLRPWTDAARPPAAPASHAEADASKHLAASMHSAVIVEGRCFAFGYDPCGVSQNYGDCSNRRPRRLKVGSPEARVAAVAVGWAFTLAIDDEGVLYGAGLNSPDFPEDSDFSKAPTHRALRLFRCAGALAAVRVVSVSAGAAHALVLDSLGACWSLGRNESGQLGRSDAGPRAGRVDGGLFCRAVSAGACHSLFVTTDGGIFS
ncbi:regulator of chromosome condensation 1/beta-lactamase-inhibitor protein II [Pelagophyceae sp. CCMP2097]|nr:regulator of chromosome condensation 1/beta-lactamase-inhibitor protein II [Pelagophyceae sp. CCMP2097]